MLGKLGKLRIRTCASEDLCVPRGDHAPALALERPAHDRRAAASGARVDELVNEVNELVWKAHSYLLAHPNMVADCYQGSAPSTVNTLRRLDLSTTAIWKFGDESGSDGARPRRSPQLPR